MGRHRDTLGIPLHGLLVVIVAMCRGHRYPLRKEILDNGINAGDLRGEGNQTQQSAAVLHHFPGGIHADFRPSGADAFFAYPVQPGTFAVDAQDLGAVLRAFLGNGSHRGDGVKCHGRGKNIDSALTCQALEIALDRRHVLFKGMVAIACPIPAGTVVVGIKNTGDDTVIAVIHRIR